MDNLAKETAKKWNYKALGQKKSVPKFEISVTIKN